MRYLMMVAAIVLFAMNPAVAGVKIAKQDENVTAMAAVAKNLKFSEPGNRAYFLVKRNMIERTSIDAPVAVFFGYVDNAGACRDIENAMTPALSSGSYHCEPI